MKGVSFSFPRLVSDPIQVSASRGIILIGALDGPIEPILKLAKRLKWPIFADILSNARSFLTDEQILCFDPILKEGIDLKPDFVLHFGERLTSKKILDWPVDLHVARSPYLQDPARKLKLRVQSDIEPFCESFEALSDPNWLEMWKKKDLEMQAKQKRDLDSFPHFTEGHLMRELSPLIPSECAVFLGNSLSIRQADLFLFPKKIKGFFGNRGLSGIDGNIATACGLIEALQTPVIAILGDQTCLYDLNSLPLLKKTPYPLILIIPNNFGGGIFSHLPIFQSPHFETYFAAKHTLQFEMSAKMFDIPYATSLKDLSFSTSQIIELVTFRKNHETCCISSRLSRAPL
jgi:2-succinyl-5-enolpyruvyl-6-hydroxy-3-cyclohexene-1-carboxylate synthase